MGGLAQEAVADGVVCQNRSWRHHIDICRMPAQGSVQLVEAALSRHESLTASTLFSRAAEVYYSTALSFAFKKVLVTHSTHKRPHTQEVVAATMAVSILLYRRLFSHSRLLA